MPNQANCCVIVFLFIFQDIFYILSEQYPGPKALVFDWSFNVTQLFNYFANMLAHPLQRPIQHKMDSKLQE